MSVQPRHTPLSAPARPASCFIIRVVLPLAAALALIVAGCGGGSDPTGGAGGGASAAAGVKPGETPAYYPVDYKQIIAGSKKEKELDIYSNTDQENWDPIFAAFKAKYPWVTKLAANNLDSDEVFQRYLSEQSSGSSPADMLVSNATQEWSKFAKRPGVLTPYQSPEKAKLPGFGEVLPNVYAMSADPATISFNTSTLKQDEQPTGIKSLAAIATQHAGDLKGKITARDVSGTWGFSLFHTYVQARPDAWASLSKILPLARPEDSSGTQIEKITSGEYNAGFFVSGAVAYPAEQKSGGLFKAVYPDDGTPVLPRGIGITSSARHPNTAKLFLDFVLSQEGQQAVAKGGLTSYRAGVAAGEGEHTYQDLVKQVGQQNVIVAKYEEVPDPEVRSFVAKWNSLVGK